MGGKKSCREVMLVGSVPLESAGSVFKCAHDHGLKPLMRRIPDGEQAGWVIPLLARWASSPALGPSAEPLPLSHRATAIPLFNAPQQLLKLRQGHAPEELMMDDMGIARGFEASYAEFKEARDKGILGSGTRFVATMAGPGTINMTLDVACSQVFTVWSRMYRNEIARILRIAPPEELAVQFDLAGEVEMEEFRRRPEAWDMPLAAGNQVKWPFDETASLVAEIANAVPEPVELGVHLCALYHVDESQGQDLNVHVDWPNTLTRKVKRPIDYIHMPTTPDYAVRDFEPLRRLELNPRTKLYLGLIHAEDGLEGATKRIRAAASVRQDFGIASFCGLKVPSRAQVQNPIPLEKIFDLHRAAAEAR
jgi:hypothetical protein